MAVALIGFQGRGRDEVVQSDFYHDLFLKALPFQLSLSRLNHGLPGCETHPEVMQRTAEFHDQIADALFPQTDPVFHNATALHATI